MSDHTAVSTHTLAGADPRSYLAYDGPGTADVTDRFDRYLADGHFRPDWMLLATRGSRVVARASFWGQPGQDQPTALDHFDIRPGEPDAADVGATLLRAAYAGVRRPDGAIPDLHMFLPARWREIADAAAIRTRIAAAEQAGLSTLAERHRLEWTTADALEDRPPRLTLRPTPAGDDPIVGLLARISEGSLDAGTSRSVAELGRDGAARSYLADMDALPGGRGLWLLGYDDTETLVGVVMPARTTPWPLVAFVGVDPAHRGKGYAVDLLVEATRRCAATGAERVRADTDVSNTPMVEVFARAGWQPWATRLVMQMTPG